MADANTAFVVLASVQGSLTVVLVGATIYYARKTRDIADETRKQAEANMKMAEAMREQTIEAREASSKRIRPAVMATKLDGNLRGEPGVTLENVGRGEALNGTVRIEWRGSRFIEHSDWRLSPGPGNHRRFQFAKDEGQKQETVDVEPRIVIECDDIDGVRWRSAREVCVENDAGACHLGKQSIPEEVRR